jgi:hypothetical protein
MFCAGRQSWLTGTGLVGRIKGDSAWSRVGCWQRKEARLSVKDLYTHQRDRQQSLAA